MNEGLSYNDILKYLNKMGGRLVGVINFMTLTYVRLKKEQTNYYN